jgi:hypothetical protein
VPFTKAKRRAYDRQRTAKRRGPRGTIFKNGFFVAWDGEGVTEQGRHTYVLLANSQAGEKVSTKSGLSTAQCMHFLIDEHLRIAVHEGAKKPIHVFYGISYDVNMMLRDLPKNIVQEIWESSLPVEFRYDGRWWKVRYRKRKSLYIGRWRSDEKWRHEKGKWVHDVDAMTLWDVHGFFQCRFVDAIVQHFPDLDCDRLAKLEAMKQKREAFAYKDLAEIRAYNQEELKLLVMLMEKTRGILKEHGIKVRSWHGAGAAASTLFLQEGVKEHLEDTPQEWEDVIRRAYFGGRAEIFGIGRVFAPIFHRDQNSSYVATLANLPSLAGAQWISGEHPGAFMRCYRLRFAFSGPQSWFPLPYRSPQLAICYPPNGEGWYWFPELLLAEAYVKRYGGRLERLDCLSILPANKTKPFAFVRELYQARVAARKGERMGEEDLLKKILASLYGKTAQQLGAAVYVDDDGNETLIKPPYFQQAWAGYITSKTRAYVGMAALTLAKDTDLVSFNTDGVVAKSPIDVPIGEGLGQWSSDTVAHLIVAQPGVYWTLHDYNEWENHSRGFMSAELLDAQPILEAWENREKTYTVSTRRFISMGSALTAPRLWKRWCQWVDTPRALDLTGASPKRQGFYPELPPAKKRKGRRPTATIVLPQPHKRWVPLEPMHATHYEYTGELSFPAPLKWAGEEPEELDEDGVPLRTVDYEIEDSYT